MPSNNALTLKQDSDHIIAMMGPTGSGKSPSIDHLTGDQGIKSGHGASSVKPEIGVRCCSAPDGRRIALVDNPGFDDSNGMTDSDVVDEIASSLKDASESRSS